MIIKLLPEQIAENWDVIRFGFMSTHPAYMKVTPVQIRNILSNLLGGMVQCWFILEEGAKEISGFVLTAVVEDYISGTKSLNIYDLYSYKQFSPDVWSSGMVALKEFATANNCINLTAQTDIPQVVEIAKKLGFNVNTTFMVLEV
jgi:hypothetical protein